MTGWQTYSRRISRATISKHYSVLQLKTRCGLAAPVRLPTGFPRAGWKRFPPWPPAGPIMDTDLAVSNLVLFALDGRSHPPPARPMSRDTGRAAAGRADSFSGGRCQKSFEANGFALPRELAHGRSICCARLIVLPASSCAKQNLAYFVPVLSPESLVLHPFELLLICSWPREYASSILYNESHIHPLAHFLTV
jgi:hypothetical protein